MIRNSLWFTFGIAFTLTSLLAGDRYNDYKLSQETFRLSERMFPRTDELLFKQIVDEMPAIGADHRGARVSYEYSFRGETQLCETLEQVGDLLKRDLKNAKEPIVNLSVNVYTTWRDIVFLSAQAQEAGAKRFVFNVSPEYVWSLHAWAEALMPDRLAVFRICAATASVRSPAFRPPLGGRTLANTMTSKAFNPLRLCDISTG